MIHRLFQNEKKSGYRYNAPPAHWAYLELLTPNPLSPSIFNLKLSLPAVDVEHI